MLDFFRVSGRAAALLALAALFIAPAQATAQSADSINVAAQTESAIHALVREVKDAAPAAVAAPLQRTVQELVGAFVNYDNQDDEQLCLAKAIYFEARGESLEGQLAVAEVVLNRVSSGRYPTTICAVVTQPAQFSFIRRGKFPSVNKDSDSWHTALAIADIASHQLADQIPAHVLWYHASYVSPSWGRRLTKVARIGTHIFYG